MSRYAFIAACLLIGLYGFDRADSGRVRMQYDQLSQEDVATQARPDRVNIVDGEDMETGDPQQLQQVIQRIASADESKYFKILGVAEDASAHDVKQAYKTLSLTVHPDKVHDEELKEPAEQAFKRVSAFYEVLGDETKRQNYEGKLKLERKQAARMKEKEMRAKMTDEYLQKKMQAQDFPILPGDVVNVVRGEGEGSTGVVYKLKDNGHLKVCLGNDRAKRPEPKMSGWGHDTSHCLKVIEAVDGDLQLTENSLKRKIERKKYWQFVGMHGNGR